MAKLTNILIPRQVDNYPAGFHADGGNLYLRVKDTGARSWVFRYKRAGKVTELGIGSKADRSLAEARELATDMRKAVKGGKNPAELIYKLDTKAMTFADYAVELIESKRSGWRNLKHAEQWTMTLQVYAFPSIGGKLPADISLADVLQILKPIWTTKTETAVRLRGRIEAVLNNAAVHEKAHGRYNPAQWKGNLDQVLAAASKVTEHVHHAASPYVDVPNIMSALRDKDFISAYCLRFTILTAARSGEARGALWSEIDMDAKTWTIPARRMKANKPHSVPLCDEAMLVLAKMREWRINDAERIFAGGRGGLLSDVAVNKTLHSISSDVTVHGFRSSFRDWGAETTAYPSRVLEMALAHGNENKTEEAYQRSKLFEKRKTLMQEWGNFCGSKGNVIQLVHSA